MFKCAILIASLAYASAGYAGYAETEHGYAAPVAGHYSSAPAAAQYSSVPVAAHYSSAPVAAHYSSAPAVSYSSFTRHHQAAPVHQGYAHAAPVLAAPSHAYATAPLAHTYAAPALSYDHSYAPSHNNYGYSAYASPLAAKTYAVAQPQFYPHNTYATQAVAAPVLASHHGYNYAPAAAGYNNLLGYNNHHGQHVY